MLNIKKKWFFNSSWPSTKLIDIKKYKNLENKNFLSNEFNNIDENFLESYEVIKNISKEDIINLGYDSKVIEKNIILLNHEKNWLNLNTTILVDVNKNKLFILEADFINDWEPEDLQNWWEEEVFDIALENAIEPYLKSKIKNNQIEKIILEKLVDKNIVIQKNTSIDIDYVHNLLKDYNNIENFYNKN